MKKVSGCGLGILALAVTLSGGLRLLAAAARGNAMSPSGTSASHGPVGYLGVDVRDIGDGQARSLKLKDGRGAEIVRVDHDGPAGKCGLREHDIVLKLNGQAIESEEQIRRMLHDLAPGRTVALLISRDGQVLTINTQMADRETVERQAWEQHITASEPVPAADAPDDQPAESQAGSATTGTPPRGSHGFLGSMLLMSPSYTGAMLEVMGPQLADFFGVPDRSGLLVRSVETNSPAAVAGMRAGDVAIRANAQKLNTTGEWAKTIRESKGRPVTVVVIRERHEVTLTLTPDGKKRSALEWESHQVHSLWACLTKLSWP
jgi:S1-C subfamily serine protease